MSDGESLVDTYIRHYPSIQPEMVVGVVQGLAAGVRVAVLDGESDDDIRGWVKGALHDLAAEWRADGFEFDRAEFLRMSSNALEIFLGIRDRIGGGTRP